MTTSLVQLNQNQQSLASTANGIPMLFKNAGEKAQYRFVEFFAAQIRNANTRAAYFNAVKKFCAWCEQNQVELEQVTPIHVALYIEQLGAEKSIPTVKQHLSAISRLFDYLVTGHIIEVNPAKSVTAPKYHVSQGKTPVLSSEDTRLLIESIDVSKVVGLRDRAIIALMVYSFARVSAVLAMNVGDYFMKGKRSWIRLHEKGSKYHEMPLHHKAEQYLDEYIKLAGIGTEKKKPLLRSLSPQNELTEKRLDRRNCWDMIKRRAKQAGIQEDICNHTFRGTGITVFLENGGKLEDAQRMANHASSKTTKLYDRRSDEVSVEMVELVRI